MSDRFSGLRENIKNQKNREKNRGEKNNYRSKDKHGFNQKENQQKMTKLILVKSLFHHLIQILQLRNLN